MEYDPSPSVSPNTKSWADKRVFAEGFCDLDRFRDLERGCGCLVGSGTRSRFSAPSDTPSSLVRYAGGGRTDWEFGECGLRERGDEKVRVGRGRGVLSAVVVLVSESEEEEMTEAFLLRSARVRSVVLSMQRGGEQESLRNLTADLEHPHCRTATPCRETSTCSVLSRKPFVMTEDCTLLRGGISAVFIKCVGYTCTTFGSS